MVYAPDMLRRSYNNIEREKFGAPNIPTTNRRKRVVQPMELGTNRKQQNAAVNAGKCYICLENPATVPDGYGGKLCQPCLTTAQQLLLNHALSQPGYSRRRPRK